MPADIFESLYNDYNSLREGPLALDPSGLSALELTYPKVLLLASASYLEVATTEVVTGLFERPDVPELRIFVERRSLKRQFHSLFDWDSAKANKLFAFFGDDCKARFIEKKRQDAEFSGSVDAFMEIGSLRNQLVHNNYAEFTLNKTAEEIKSLHKLASSFPPMIPSIVFLSDPVEGVA